MGCSQAIIPKFWGLSCQIHANTQKKTNKQTTTTKMLCLSLWWKRKMKLIDVELYLTLYALPNMESRNNCVMLTPTQ